MTIEQWSDMGTRGLESQELRAMAQTLLEASGKATPGPWEYTHGFYGWDMGIFPAGATDKLNQSIITNSGHANGDPSPEDAALIVLFRNSAPALAQAYLDLLDRVALLQAEVGLPRGNVSALPVEINEKVRSGAPVIEGTGIAAHKLLSAWVQQHAEHQRLHAGGPFDVACRDWTHQAIKDFCGNYSSISIDQAEEALGFMLLALARQALARIKTEFNPAMAALINPPGGTGDQ